MTHRTAKSPDPYRTIYHRDFSCTIWDVHAQAWHRFRYLPEDHVLASLSAEERARVALHIAGGPNVRKDAHASVRLTDLTKRRCECVTGKGPAQCTRSAVIYARPIKLALCTQHAHSRGFFAWPDHLQGGI